MYASLCDVVIANTSQAAASAQVVARFSPTSVAMACIRYEADEAEMRNQAIKINGQHARASIAVLGEQLLVVKLEALEGFVHLAQDPEDCIAAYGPYHISICQVELVEDADVTELRSRWDGVELTLPIADVRRDGYMELGPCALIQDPVITRLHGDPRAWYNTYQYHISG